MSWRRWAMSVAAATLLSSCGGSSVESTCIGCPGLVAIDTPTGPNTTEIVVDSGPGFSLGAVNVPSVTVTLCSPGSASACVTIDHVFVDTGSIGLRVFKSRLGSLSLPPLQLAADAASGTPAGPAAECYAFVLGAVWGPMARADVRIGGEAAPDLPVQVIDDAATPSFTAPADCLAAANGGLLNSPSSLQANGILGIGMLAYDCGLNCATANYAGGHVPYYSCPGGPASCVPAAVPAAAQAQNPISSFIAGSDGVANNNGSIIVMPALPDIGASVARGRLVFGIGTQANNQIPASAKVYPVDADPASATYLYQRTAVDGRSYPASYIDSGSNALFFEDSSLPLTCKSQSDPNGASGWYCPSSLTSKSATFTGADGTSSSIDFAIGNADRMFAVGEAIALSHLGGTVGQGADTFVWGLPFFYGRSVFTSIWGQALSPNGPWNAF